MIVTYVVLLFCLVLGFVALSTLVGVEVRTGRRVVLGGVRAWCDTAVDSVTRSLRSTVLYIDRHIIKLSWYYSLHSVLQAALRVVVSLYDYLEHSFHSNRKRARAIRAERRVKKDPSGMLHNVALHKETTALSNAEKKKLLTKKLERE